MYSVFESMIPRGVHMQKTLVLTVVGRDRTGLVESLARLIADAGGNWLESRMCRLGGEFAGILRASVPEEREDSLAGSLEGLKSEGLTVVIRHDAVQPSAQPARTATLSLVGHDRPGIIYQISAALAHQNVSFEELTTEFSSAPMSGDMIFKASARLQIPPACSVSELQKELEELGSELMVDIRFVA
jgi:glycine cleavage system regulatory protein